MAASRYQEYLPTRTQEDQSRIASRIDELVYENRSRYEEAGFGGVTHRGRRAHAVSKAYGRYRWKRGFERWPSV